MVDSALMSLTLDELCARAEISPRQIRRYATLGITRGALRRGPGAPYDDEDLVRILAARALSREGVGLIEISRMMYAMPVAEMYARAGIAPPSVAMSEVTEPPKPPSVAPDVTLPDAEAWAHIELLPDLELHVRAGASPIVQRIAHEIVANYKSRV